MNSKKIRCIFCDQRRPQAIEDVIPHWIMKELGGTPPFSSDYFNDVKGAEAESWSKESTALDQLKLQGVCHACNNEWMSRLENLIKPLLVTLIRDEPRMLSAPECRLIAAWCQLKCISIDAMYAAHRGGIRHLPPEIAYTFGQQMQPLLNSTVIIGRFEHPKAGVMVRWGRHMGNVAASYERPPINLVTVTMALGFLITKVMIGAWMPETALEARFPLAPSWSVPCWPLDLTSSFPWPPVESITPGNFDFIASNGTNAHRFVAPEIK